MIVLDLKVTLLVLLLAMLGLPTGILWLWQRRGATRRHRAGWTTYTHLPLAIAIYDGYGREIFANAAARQLLDALPTETRDTLHRLVRDGNTTAASARHGALHQPQPLRWWRIPLDDGLTLLALADWSDRQRLVRQQQAFIGQLAHELRTPLTALTAHIELVRSPQSSAAVRESSLATLQRETQRMARLVRDLLELHRLETAGALALRPTDVVLVAEAAIAQVILLAEARGLDLTFETDAQVPPVLAEPDRLTQVFLNLLDNAIKYCRPGDQIRVTLRALPQGVECAIHDSGPGIPADDLPHVTERLYRGRVKAEGTGIGLALVQEILRQHHTTLTIDSLAEGPATGTTCAWLLPYAGPAAAGQQDRQPSAPTP